MYRLDKATYKSKVAAVPAWLISQVSCLPPPPIPPQMKP